MPPTVTHTELIANARREIRALKRPVGIQRNTWTGVLDILRLIAGYLPEPYPSQRTIAAKLDLHRTTVTRRLALAERLGLIRRTDRPNPGGLMDGTNYHFACFSEGLAAALTRTRFQDTNCTQTKNSYSVGVHNAPPFREVLPAGLRPADQKDNVVPFNRPSDDDWSSPAIGEDPNGPLPPAATVKVDPAVYLARRFDGKWADAARRDPALRVSRASSRGMAIGYLRKVMLTQVSPEHAEAYMDAFVEAAAAGDVVVKEGQFAFERFTHWWGREDVEDPAEHLAKREISQRMHEEYQEYLRSRGLTNG